MTWNVIYVKRVKCEIKRPKQRVEYNVERRIQRVKCEIKRVEYDVERYEYRLKYEIKSPK